VAAEGGTTTAGAAACVVADSSGDIAAGTAVGGATDGAGAFCPPEAGEVAGWNGEELRNRIGQSCGTLATAFVARLTWPGSAENRNSVTAVVIRGKDEFAYALRSKLLLSALGRRPPLLRRRSNSTCDLARRGPRGALPLFLAARHPSQATPGPSCIAESLATTPCPACSMCQSGPEPSCFS
jgi:hypothetical protein